MRPDTGRTEQRQRIAAVTAGAALLIMAAAAMFAYGIAHGRILVQGDGAATLHNLIERSELFRAEIFGWLVILLCDLVVAWACYVFFKMVHEPLALLGAWLRLAYTAILGIAIAQLLVLPSLAGRAVQGSSFSFEQLGEQAMLHLTAFASTWSMGLVVFGGHLLVLGQLVLRTGRMPRWIGVLLQIAAFGYMFVHLKELVWADAGKIGEILEQVLLVPMTAGELIFALWLLVKGGKDPLLDAA